MAAIDRYYDANIKTRESMFDANITVPFANIPYQNLNIGLNSKTLSDTFSGTTYREAANIGIDDAIKGTLLDFPFQFKVETISKSGSQIAFTGRYNADAMLFTKYSMMVPTEAVIGIHDGKNIVRVYTFFDEICKAMGFTGRFYCRNWPAADGVWLKSGTYQQYLSSIFGWIPLAVCDVNVFLRGNVLYCVQRGQERSVIAAGYGKVVTITNAANVKRVPSVQMQRIRTESGLSTSWPDSAPPEDAITDDQQGQPFTGVIQFGDASLTYVNGYLMKRVQGSVTTTYVYLTIGDKQYLQQEEVIDSQALKCNKTVYHYYTHGGVLYLAQEERWTGGMVVEGVPTYSSATKVRTDHSPLGNSWFGVTTTNETTGDVQTSLVQGASANAVNQYMINQTQQQLGGFKGNVKSSLNNILAKLLGAPNINTNWSIDTAFGRQDIAWMAGICDWMNNCFEVTITMDLYNVKVNNTDHIIDFTDLISYNNHLYCLESNSIKSGITGIIQTVTLKRWIKGNEVFPQ